MTWLQEEILKIRGDQIYNKTHPDYKRNYMKQIIMCCAVAILTASYCYSDIFPCPHCAQPIEITHEAKGILKDVWVCPKCSYENYEGISTCCQCGYYRYRW